MAQVQETSNYEKFELLDFNRDVGKTKQLELSMKKFGFRTCEPLDVMRNGNGKLKIRQGHHRLFVARKLGIPVKYVISDDDISIYEIERTRNRWSIMDYLISWCRKGNPHYLAVKEYIEKTGISLSHAISMLGGHSAGSGNFLEVFKIGEYRIKDNRTHADIVASLVVFAKNQNIPFYNGSLLVQAFSKCVWLEEFNVSQMKQKMKVYAGMFEKKANLEKHLELVEDIYNKQSHKKVPLKFLAMEAAKQRNALFLNNKK